jgi:hypothetical protein
MQTSTYHDSSNSLLPHDMCLQPLAGTAAARCCLNCGTHVQEAPSTAPAGSQRYVCKHHISCACVLEHSLPATTGGPVHHAYVLIHNYVHNMQPLLNKVLY